MGQGAGGPRPYFFLAYARTRERSWVEKLFQDLCTEIVERTDLPVTAEAGFMDRRGIRIGSDWREEVTWALANCQVFVPLYSPRYFTREECGKEWHAFAQRILDHRARRPGNAAAIVPALWTPVDPDDLPDVARRVQVDHAELGEAYAEEGFYTLIKNTLYRQEYTTAVQRLARQIIGAARTSQLQPCRERDLGELRNAFDMPDRRTPADRRVNLIVAAPSADRLPGDRNPEFYGRAARDWNPYHPQSQQALAEYAQGVVRLGSYEPTVLTLDEGCDLVSARDPAAGLGILLLDAWSVADEGMARRLLQFDAVLDVDWVETMVPWNPADRQTMEYSETLRARLRTLLPNRIGQARPALPTNSIRIETLEDFRTKLPQVLEHALSCYLTYAEAHPPVGSIPPRPRLSGSDDPGTVRRQIKEEDPA
jgi:FxsC-like protein